MRDAFSPAIIDYGLAKLQDDLPCSTSGQGTSNYRAAELISIPPSRRTKASDIWALAGVCYAVSPPLLAAGLPDHLITYEQMYCGRDPYKEDGVHPIQVWSAILQGPPKRPTRRNLDYEAWSAIPDELWNLLLSCWDANRDERPSINKVLRKLEGMTQ